MAKPASIKIRLNSTADTGFFYVTKKNARTMTENLVLKKNDPVVLKHVEFKAGKIMKDRPSRFDYRSARSQGPGVSRFGPPSSRRRAAADRQALRETTLLRPAALAS